MFEVFSDRAAAEIERQRYEDTLLKANARLEDAIKLADQANIAKSLFLANMSHEIRTPLNGIMGMIEILEDTTTNTKSKQRLSALRDSSDFLLTILNNILDISKIEAGKMQVFPEVVPIENLVHDLETIWRSKIEQKGISLLVENTLTPEASIETDQGKARQILENIINNAYKFTKTGQISLRISRLTDGQTRFEVKDTGLGIAEDQLPHLFEKFVQLDASTTREMGGSGLGLAICRELSLLIDGQIAVASQEGVGTTFVLDLPGPPADRPAS